MKYYLSSRKQPTKGATMYAPLELAKEAVTDFIMPDVHKVSFKCTREEVSEPYDKVGTEFKVTALVQDTPARCYETFLVPSEEGDVETFKNRISKVTGKKYKDQSFEKFLKLQGTTGANIETVDDVLDMFAKADVAWPINLEVSAASKDKDHEPIDNWDQIRDFFTDNVKHSARWSESEGTDYVRWTLYRTTDENKALVEQAQDIQNIRFRNTLNGYGKVVSVG